MNIQSALKHQYHAALQTLRLAIERCPDALWNHSQRGCAPFWRVAYHTLFFTHMYLQQNRKQFRPWDKHRKGINNLGRTSTAKPSEPVRPYTRNQILEYWRICDNAIDAGVDALDLNTENGTVMTVPFNLLSRLICPS